MKIQMKTFAAAALGLLLSVSLFAQPGPDKGKDCKGEKCDWKERIQAEKVGFISVSLELTPKEAEVFWPVYNAVTKEREKKMSDVHKKYFALKNAIVQSQSKDINKLLEEYAAAMAANGADEEKWLQKYLEVLSPEKVAKLYVAEETFRRQQIGKLGGGPGKGRPDGERPDGCKPGKPDKGKVDKTGKSDYSKQDKSGKANSRDSR